MLSRLQYKVALKIRYFHFTTIFYLRYRLRNHYILVLFCHQHTKQGLCFLTNQIDHIFLHPDTPVSPPKENGPQVSKIGENDQSFSSFSNLRLYTLFQCFESIESIIIHNCKKKNRDDFTLNCSLESSFLLYFSLKT